MDEGIEFHKVRYRTTEHYLAYFQSFSNTYAPLERLRELYEEALTHPQVVGIVIGTRPDCVDEQKLDYLADLAHGRVLKGWSRHLMERVPEHDDTTVTQTTEQVRTAPIVIVEYGIESCYDATLQRINRGHDYACAVDAVVRTAVAGIPVGAHIILGLPGEGREELMRQATELSRLPLTTLKLHQLQVVRGTRMAEEYAEKPSDFHIFAMQDYIETVIDYIERLNPNLVLERFASQSPKELLIAPDWGIKNHELVDKVKARMRERGTWQGRLYRKEA
jgi:radical SAM superfamily enzyme